MPDENPQITATNKVEVVGINTHTPLPDAVAVLNVAPYPGAIGTGIILVTGTVPSPLFAGRVIGVSMVQPVEYLCDVCLHLLVALSDEGDVLIQAGYAGVLFKGEVANGETDDVADVFLDGLQ